MNEDSESVRYRAGWGGELGATDLSNISLS